MKKILTAALFACTLFGQSERGNITGIVTDQSGGAIPGAEVVITHRATNTVVKLTTTTSGEYNAAGLNPGEFNVDASANGFRRYTQTNAVLTASATLRIDIKLQVGTVTDTVEVVASAAQVQTENARVATPVNSVLVDSLPLVV